MFYEGDQRTSRFKSLISMLRSLSLLSKIGLLIAALSLVGILFVFFPVIKEEIRYLFRDKNINQDIVVDVVYNDEPNKINSIVNNKKIIVASDKNFSIVIPKIGANSKVIENVDPYDIDEYIFALSRGVAHSKDSSFPGIGGNTFIFAHSTDNFFNANRYNSVFYLLSKLEKDDEYYLIYKENIYKYKVIDIKIVNSSDISYLQKNSLNKDSETSVLMTCWPPGTTLNRLVVIGILL